MSRLKFLAVVVAALSSVTVDAKGTMPVSLCSATEDIIYNCESEKKAVYISVCGVKDSRGPRSVSYRYGQIGNPEFTYSTRTNGPMSLKRFDYSGGGEMNLAFSVGRYRYIVYDRMIRTGFKTTNDPQMEAGIAIREAGKKISTKLCYDAFESPVTKNLDTYFKSKIIKDGAQVDMVSEVYGDDENDWKPLKHLTRPARGRH